MILSLSNDTELDLFGLFGASLFFIAGLAGVMALVNNLKRRQYHVEITFDSIAQQMCYSQEGANGVYEVGYGLFDHLEVEKEVKTSSNSGSSTSSRTTYYHIYLILKSNTRFWLFTVVNSKKKAREKVELFNRSIPVSLVDRSDLNVAEDRVFESESDRHHHTYEHSKFLRWREGPSGIRFDFKRRKSGQQRFLMGLVFYFFFGVPAMIGVSVFSEPTPVFLQILACVFISVFVLIALFIIMLGSRDYEIGLAKEGVSIALRSKSALFRRILEKEIQVPASDIDSVQVDREKQGKFFLSLRLHTLPAISGWHKLLFNIGAFSSGRKSASTARTMRLWEVSMAENGSKGAYLGDLLRVKDAIDAYYHLKGDITSH